MTMVSDSQSQSLNQSRSDFLNLASASRKNNNPQLEINYQQQQPIFYWNDPTIRLSPDVDRLWLHDVSESNKKRNLNKPKTKLVLTDIGWNHPNQTKGLTEFTRSIRSRELLQAFVDHPLFDPTFRWTDMMNGKSDQQIDATLQYVVLMDIESCFEQSWPFNYAQYAPNADKEGGRVVNGTNAKEINPCFWPCVDIIQPILDSPLFQQAKAATLLYIDCSGNGPLPSFRHKRVTSRQLTLLSLSSGPHQILERDVDMGLPPPAVKPVTLSETEQRAIRTCASETPEQRPYLFTFIGTTRPNSPRRALFELNKQRRNKDVILWRTTMFQELVAKNKTTIKYDNLLKESVFGAAPRGINRFSYRFTEVLSAGAIPVVHSDGWVLPFRPELVDWNKCAVLIPEADVNQTIDILRNIPTEKRCQMRQYCYEQIYQKYMASPAANIAGILDSIKARDHLDR